MKKPDIEMTRQEAIEAGHYQKFFPADSNCIYSRVEVTVSPDDPNKDIFAFWLRASGP